MKRKKWVFISSKQDELQVERDRIRTLIQTDNTLSAHYLVSTFERDESGRKESVRALCNKAVLRSDVYLGIFDQEYSAPSIEEYECALADKFLPKEIVLCIRRRDECTRHEELRHFLSRVLNPDSGHACKVYESTEELERCVQEALIGLIFRTICGGVISEEAMGKDLDGLRFMGVSEEFRRALCTPIGLRFGRRGRDGILECYGHNESGEAIDLTWVTINAAPSISDETKQYYQERYRKPYDTSRS